MPDTPRPVRLAVLIDAENTSPRIADRLFKDVAELGEARVRRIYGDFSGTRLAGWADIIQRHALIPHQQFNITAGKNAADIALVIDAMDLLHGGRIEGFCLVSSDSDFTRLAVRIREQGLDVYGFGEARTAESFRRACRRFIFTDTMQEQLSAGDAANKAATTAPPVAKPPPTPTTKPKDTSTNAVPLLCKALASLTDDDGWVSLSSVGEQLRRDSSNFDPRIYGSAKLSKLVAATGAFEMSVVTGKGARIRLRPGGRA